MSFKLTVIVVFYNMQREAPRTLHTLTRGYQRDIEGLDYEVIAVDNGSSRPLDAASVEAFGAEFRYLFNDTTSVSPAGAINRAAAMATGSHLTICIDGARMLSPGVLRHTWMACRLSTQPVVAVLGWHLGHKRQRFAMQEGYDQAVEDRLLDSVDWRGDGYRLFDIACLAGSSASGWFKPIAESNALTVSRATFEALGGYDEAFTTPGGGLVNLDFYKRACERPGAELVVLLSEGCFHQYHGGAATNAPPTARPEALFKDEYLRLRGQPYVSPAQAPTYLGGLPAQARRFLRLSLDALEAPAGAEGASASAMPAMPAKPEGIMMPDLPVAPVVPAMPVAAVAVPTPRAAIETAIDSPIVVTGRGGSGTRLCSQVLQALDVFLGNRINHTDDSEEWVDPIYSIAVAAWRDGKRETARSVKRLRVRASAVLEEGLWRPGQPWGWKLPETMLVLPEVEAAFPRARFIQVVRHPLDTCLRRSHMTSRPGNQVGAAVLAEGYRRLGWNRPPEDDPEHLRNAASWLMQLEEALAFEASVGPERCLRIRYEDLCDQAEASALRIAAFLGLPPRQVSLGIEAQRRRRWDAEDPRVDEVWRACGALGQRLGYQRD